TPHKLARWGPQGPPRPSLRRFGSGNNGTNTAHCSSLNKASRFFIEQAHHPTRLTQSHSLEAAPIYATSSRFFRGIFFSHPIQELFACRPHIANFPEPNRLRVHLLA